MKTRLAFNVFLVALLISTSFGCSTIRMKYEGNFKTEDGKTGRIDAEKSYDLGGSHSTMCAITAIFLGGYCWYYTVMPTTQQRQQMEADVQVALKEKLNTDKFTLTPQYNDKKNWDKSDSTLNVNLEKKAF